MNYQDWNEKLAAHFFSKEREGQRVFLSVNPDLLQRIGGENALDDFISEASHGPAVSEPNICRKALRSMSEWRTVGATGFPPYIAVLSLFVLAASLESEHGQGGYYKQLRSMLGLTPGDAAPPDFRECLGLWDDLETWSCKDRRGEFGEFRVEFAGKWMYVGVPASQNLLTEHECASLPEVFCKAGIDPSMEIGNEELAQAVIEYGPRIIDRRTLKRLSGQGEVSEEFRSKLIERLQDVLASCREEELNFQGASGERHRHVRLVLCLKPHDLLPQAETFVCFDTLPILGECSPTLRSENGSIEASANIDGSRWAFLFLGKSYLPGTSIDWVRGESFQCQELKLRFSIPGRSVRIFENGERYQSPFLIERAKLSPGAPFWLAVQQDAADVIKWGETLCKGWKKIEVGTGLPRGWHLFHALEPGATDSIEQKFPTLSLPVERRLRLAGGLRIGKGNKFLDLAPPRVIAPSSDAEWRLVINGSPISWQPGELTIRKELLLGQNTVELFLNGDDRAASRASFRLINASDSNWRFNEGCGSFPGELQSRDALISGAAVSGLSASPFPFGHSVSDTATTLIGSKPGQIAKGRSVHEKMDWNPVWVVTGGRKNRKAIFCGTSIAESSPSPEVCPDKRAAREWKDLIYHERKNIRPPTDSKLSSLWSAYLERAKNV